METKKKYKVLRAIARDGARDRGSIIELTEVEATNLGSEYLEEIPRIAAPESAPVTTGEKVEEEASRPAPRKERKNRNNLIKKERK